MFSIIPEMMEDLGEENKKLRKLLERALLWTDAEYDVDGGHNSGNSWRDDANEFLGNKED